MRHNSRGRRRHLAEGCAGGRRRQGSLGLSVGVCRRLVIVAWGVNESRERVQRCEWVRVKGVAERAERLGGLHAPRKLNPPTKPAQTAVGHLRDHRTRAGHRGARGEGRQRGDEAHAPLGGTGHGGGCRRRCCKKSGCRPDCRGVQDGVGG